MRFKNYLQTGFLFTAATLILLLSAMPVIAEDKVLLTTLEWEPYIGPNMPGKGYVNEIVSEAFKRAGYLAVAEFFPWARAVAMAETGERDGLFPEYFDEKRTEKFEYSDPFPGGPVGFCKRKDLPVSLPSDPAKNLTETLKGLKQYRFGVVRGYINTPEFDAATFLSKDEAVSDEANLKKLFHNRIQLIFIDKFVANHLIAQKFPEYKDVMEFMEPPLEMKPLYIAFSKQAKNYKVKLNAFNRGLKQIREDGTLQKIMAAHGF